jgi:hypothetical protein
MSQTTPRCPGAGRTTLGLAAALTFLLQQASAVTVTVQAPQKIQPAIDAAAPGDIIKVKAGTYNEQLVFNGKNGITLIGTNAILNPPAIISVNDCSYITPAILPVGICINGKTTGSPAAGEHIVVAQSGPQIKNTVVSGFKVSGFPGANIAVIGAIDTTVSGNTLLDGGVFGLISITSTNTMATGNIITSSAIGTTGMSMADTAASTFLKNNVTGYATGVRIEVSSGIVKDNYINNCCMGITVNPKVAGAVLSTNHIKDVNPVCSLPTNTDPAGGILVNGGIKSNIKGNVASNLHRAGNAAGITLTDSTTPPSVASDNRFLLNFLLFDDVTIKKATTGTGNTFI